MNDNLTAENAANLLTDLASNQKVDLEVLITESQNFRASYQKRKLDQFGASHSRALGVRVINQGREGYAFTEDFSAPALNQVFEEAVASSRLIEKPYEPQLRNSSDVPRMPAIFDASIDSTSVEEKLAAAQKLESDILDYDPRIASVPYNTYQDSKSTVQLYNTKGLSSAYNSSLFFIYGYALAKENDQAGMSLAESVSRSFSNLNPQAVVERSAGGALARLNAVQPETGNYPVVLFNRAARTLLQLIGNYFSAKSVDEKTSPLAGKLGQKIFSESITIIDDALDTRGFFARPFDDEGTRSQKTTLVESGVLQSYLTNSVYASKLGLPNTANASRSPSSELEIGTSNFKVKPGTDSLNKLLASYPRVVLLENIKGTAGFNWISGDFSLESEGSLYVNGELETSLTNFVVSGNVMQLLANVLAAGNDAEVSSSPVISPSLLISELTIAGQ